MIFADHPRGHPNTAKEWFTNEQLHFLHKVTVWVEIKMYKLSNVPGEHDTIFVIL